MRLCRNPQLGTSVPSRIYTARRRGRSAALPSGVKRCFIGGSGGRGSCRAVTLCRALVAAITLCATAWATELTRGEPAPQFSLRTLDGKTTSLTEYSGQALVLVYWRTGQDRSVTALQEAQEVSRSHAQKGVRLVSAVSGDETPDVVREVTKSNGINCAILVDVERKLFHDYGVIVYPTTFLLDKTGAFRYSIPGCPPTYKKTLDDFVKVLLGEMDEKALDDTLAPSGGALDKPQSEALRLYNLALQLGQSGMVEQAVQTVSRSISAKPDRAQSHALLGYLLLETSEVEKAVSAFRKAIELDPLSHDARTGLGRALLTHGEVDAAIEILKKNVNEDPCPQVDLYELGRAYEAKRDKDAALGAYRAAAEKAVSRELLPSSLGLCQ